LAAITNFTNFRICRKFLNFATNRARIAATYVGPVTLLYFIVLHINVGLVSSVVSRSCLTLSLSLSLRACKLK